MARGIVDPLVGSDVEAGVKVDVLGGPSPLVVISG